MDWFLYDNGLRHERVKSKFNTFLVSVMKTWNIVSISIRNMEVTQGEDQIQSPGNIMHQPTIYSILLN